jgi:hypothetical protein
VLYDVSYVAPYDDVAYDGVMHDDDYVNHDDDVPYDVSLYIL